MNKDLKCTICNQRYRDPKFLPCFHCFCRDCIDLLRVRGRETFHCPECRSDVRIPDNDVDKLQDAITVYHKMELSRLQQKLGSGTVNCEECTKADVGAEAFCAGCAKHICGRCVHKHQTELEYSHHEVTSFQDIQESQDGSLYHGVLTTSRAASFNNFVRCSQHQDEKISRYCYKCATFICSVCADTEHKQHQHNRIEKANEKCKRDLEDQLPNVRALRKRITGGAHDVLKTKCDVENQGKSLASFVDTEFERISRILERHKAQLKTRLNQMVEGRAKKLLRQHDELTASAAELERLEEVTEDSLETTTERELLLLYKFTKERISEVTQRCSRMCVDPVEVPNLTVYTSSSGAFSEMFREHANLYCKKADPSKCTANGEGLKSAETLATSQFSVRISDKSSKPCDSAQHISVMVKCLSNDISFYADVTDEGGGHHQVLYCPKFRGKHEITVQVNDAHISGSPFSVQVYQPPNQIERSQALIDGIKGPRGIALNRKGNLLVSEWNGGKIVELNKFGQHVRSFGTHLHHPAAIATDDAGNSYVTDAAGEHTRIVKFSPDGKVMKEFGRQGVNSGEFKNPRGLAISQQNELYVCDRDNDRIQVFSKNLGFIRSIDIRAVDTQRTHPCKPNDLTFDRAGNMYITDIRNNCIHCMTVSGQFLLSFSSEGDAPGYLAGPESIHCDNKGFLYVTEYKNHRVSVFKLNGDFVSKFGVLGSGDSELKFPMGIVTDEDGFVYVCELFNNRVQIF